jgi:hypothetical protein
MSLLNKEVAWNVFIVRFSSKHRHGLLVNKTRSLSAGASIGIDIYKGLQNQNTLRNLL